MSPDDVSRVRPESSKPTNFINNYMYTENYTTGHYQTMVPFLPPIASIIILQSAEGRNCNSFRATLKQSSKAGMQIGV